MCHVSVWKRFFFARLKRKCVGYKNLKLVIYTYRHELFVVVVVVVLHYVEGYIKYFEFEGSISFLMALWSKAK